MAYEGNCTSDVLGTGVQNVCIKWGNIVKIERTTPDFYFATEALAATEAATQDAIQNKYLFPFPTILQQNVNDEDNKSEDLALGSIEINKGKKDSDFLIQSNPYMDKIFQSHSNVKSGIFFIDNNGGKRGVVGKDGEFMPIPVQLFQVKKPEENDGAAIGFKSMIRVVISDIENYINNAAIITFDKFDFDPRQTTGLEPVTIAVVGTPTATTLTVKATISGTVRPVRGLSETPGIDFTIKGVDGLTENAPNTITDNSDGTYDMAFTALVTGSTVNIKAPNVAGVTPGYESLTAATITF